MNKKTLLLIFLLLSFIPFTALAQTITVGGRVISGEDGYGLPGVTIQVKGTQKGTVSDMDGNYSVQVASNGTLVFSYVGYKTKEVAVNGKTKINVTLETNALMLDDVVVTALGIKRQKRELGYATEEIGGDMIAKSGSGSVISALSGRSAGVQIVNAQGAIVRNFNFEGSTTIDVSDLSAGVYIVQLLGGKLVTRKIVVL